MNEQLPKLAGMAYHGGKTVAHWIKLVGVDPRAFPRYIQVRKGLCYWLPAAEAAYQKHVANVRANWHALGV
jgi:hypothetical protein